MAEDKSLSQKRLWEGKAPERSLELTKASAELEIQLNVYLDTMTNPGDYIVTMLDINFGTTTFALLSQALSPPE